MPVEQFDRPINNEDLPSASIRALFQDSQGYIWIATTTALLLYDGSELYDLKHNPNDSTSISDSWINTHSIIEHAGYVWIATRNGLNRYDRDTKEFKRYFTNTNGSSEQCSYNMTTLAPKDAQSLWLGTRQNGLCAFNFITNEVQAFKSDSTNAQSISSNFITSIQPAGPNKVWLGTNNGLNFLDTQSGHAIRFLEKQNDTSLDDQSSHIQALLLQSNKLWIGTEEGGVLQLDTTSHEITSPFSDETARTDVLDLHLDSSQNLWIAFFDQGLCKLSKDSETLQCYDHNPGNSFSLIDGRVSALMEDKEKQLWVGTWGGISKSCNNPGFETIPFYATESFVPQPSVSAILEYDDTTILLGGIEVGLFRAQHKPTTQTAQSTAQQLFTSGIRSITQDKKNVWLTVSGEGITLYDPTLRKEVFDFPYNSLDSSGIGGAWTYDLHIDKQQTLWVSTHTNGLNKLVDFPRKRFTKYNAENKKLSSSSIWKIYEASDGFLWLGTLDTGLIKFNPKNETYSSYFFDPAATVQLAENSVSHISPDNKGALWISSVNGLHRFNPDTEAFKTYRDELSNPQVFCALTDPQHRTWIATRNGLTVFDEPNDQFIKLYQQNGLPSHTFFPDACHIGESGRFYFGTEAGLLTFMPENITLDVPDEHNVVVTAFELNNAPQRLEPDLALDYNENTLSFRVAALSYVDSEKNEVSYRLLGFDPTWRPVEGPVIQFTGLPSNDYTLEIKAKNSFGREGKNTYSTAFSIAPPFWRTTWFWLLMIFLVGAIVYTGFRIRLNYELGLTQRSHAAALKLEKLRNDLAADFHDGVGGSLGSLGIEMGLLANQEDVPSGIKSKLHHFISKLNRISELRREMSWVINTKNDTLSHLIDRIRQVAFDIIPKEILELDLPTVSPAITMPMETRRQLFFLMKEAMHNAVNHASASKIEVSIIERKDGYSFYVKDNGTGFDAETITRGNGLDNMAQRAAAVEWYTRVPSERTRRHNRQACGKYGRFQL